MNNSYLYSIIIPVYNSEKIVEKTVKRTFKAMHSFGLKCEIILINDGSPDNSWKVIKEISKSIDNVIAINLLKNYGQHTAVLCGIKNSKGDFIITMDDDLQNPPQEIIKLVTKIHEGYDLVFGKFKSKRHSFIRRLGTKAVNYFNEKIFNKPKDIKLTNFRIFKREVANLATSFKTNYPYIPGLLLMFASNIGNTYTEHHSREIGKSNYSFIKIIQLLSRLFFNYSSYPLKVLTFLGFSVAAISFLTGAFVFFKALVVGAAVPGWSSIAVMLSFFNGILILMLGVLGIYVSRIMQQISSPNPYSIKEISSIGIEK